jgi:hypothetical protein
VSSGSLLRARRALSAFLRTSTRVLPFPLCAGTTALGFRKIACATSSLRSLRVRPSTKGAGSGADPVSHGGAATPWCSNPPPSSLTPLTQASLRQHAGSSASGNCAPHLVAAASPCSCAFLCPFAPARDPYTCPHAAFWLWDEVRCYELKDKPPEEQYSPGLDGPNDPSVVWKKGSFRPVGHLCLTASPLPWPIRQRQPRQQLLVAS